MDRAPASSSSGEPPSGGSGLGDLVPAVELPRGGGALRGIGESFSANAVTGTAALTIPVFTSPSRALTPSVALGYDSGAGNGLFGLGWQASVPSVRRKTERGLPRYDDVHDSDVFVLSEAEDLVPWLEQDGEAWVHPVIAEADHDVHRYRPRVEGAFARIERWVERATSRSHWRVWSRDNVLSIFGEDPQARIAHPRHPERVFEWLLERVQDDRGNITRFSYKAEDLAGVEPSLPYEA
ncbi:MAG: toxin, partial [Deltaproteobacteria bacterium]|nr:toxin [Nannocystaceae bacterium]